MYYDQKLDDWVKSSGGKRLLSMITEDMSNIGADKGIHCEPTASSTYRCTYFNGKNLNEHDLSINALRIGVAEMTRDAPQEYREHEKYAQSKNLGIWAERKCQTQ